MKSKLQTVNSELRTFVLGDIHGGYRAMIQCFEKAGFDYNNDRLICLGDVFDGWSEAGKCIDELLKIKKLVYILGNHDCWTLEWALTGSKPDIWLDQVALSTISNFEGKMPKRYIDFLQNGKLYYIENNRLFVHAGFVPGIELDKQDKEILIWNRNFVQAAYYYSRINKKSKFTNFDEVYVGHTPTIVYEIDHPFQCGEIWLMDTGAGWNGKLSIINIDTKEYFQSDRVTDLYPNEKGRF